MAIRGRCSLGAALGAVLVFTLCATGCHTLHKGPSDFPRELEMVSHPSYVIEPPDILLIDAVRVVPLPPYRVEPLDVLFIRFPAKPLGKDDMDKIEKSGWAINGLFPVEPDGKVDLGPRYGKLKLIGEELEGATKIVRAKVLEVVGEQLVKDGEVSVELAESKALQQVRGEHLVRQDGTVGLGTYGNVYVAGLTINGAKAALEDHLSKFLFKPEVSVDVLGYNSKLFHIIIDVAGAGQQVTQLPVTGNETVLTAIGQIGGIPPNAAKNRMWVARPAPAAIGCDQILKVNWTAISQGGSTATNYQLFPGDRLYVKADAMVTVDYFLARVFSPIERILGITLLGNSTYRVIEGGRPGATGGDGGGFGF